MYQSLAAQASDDPRLQTWIEAQEERFSWGTKQYEALAARFAGHVALVRDGGVLAGPRDEVCTAAELSRTYGVPMRVDRRPEGTLAVWPDGERA